MPLATFVAAAAPDNAQEFLTRAQVAARLELHLAAVDKLIRAGIINAPLMATEIGMLARRPFLQVVEGELTVLRTDARADAYRDEGDDRAYIGFHTEHSDQELEQTSLRWWRSDPERVVDNELFVVTVGTFPVALYRITERLSTKVREDEDRPRHCYGGQLLARVHSGIQNTFAKDMPGYLQERARQVMNSRIVVSSGGPIGYLDATISKEGAS
jgi:hypothetical protein